MLYGTRIVIIRCYFRAILRTGSAVPTIIALDDESVVRAQVLTHLKEKSALVREALKALIERESARRLALLGGTEPDLELTPRRRLDPK